MRGERRKRRSQVRLSAARTGERVSVAANELLELVATIVTDIFVNRHFSQAPENGFSFNSIAQVGRGPQPSGEYVYRRAVFLPPGCSRWLIPPPHRSSQRMDVVCA